MTTSAFSQGTTSPNLKYWYPIPKSTNPEQFAVDVAVYGETSAGVMAAVQAARSGKTTALFAFGTHVGGLTSGGLNATDGGSHGVTGGLAREYYNKAGEHGFTASRAEAIFNEFLADENVSVHYLHRLVKVNKTGSTITGLVFENGNSVQAKMFIDATYEGDLYGISSIFAKADVWYPILCLQSSTVPAIKRQAIQLPLENTSWTRITANGS